MQKLHVSEEMRNKLAQIKKAVAPTAFAAGLALSGANGAVASQDGAGVNPQVGAAGVPSIVSGVADPDPAVKGGANGVLQAYGDCGPFGGCSGSCSGTCSGSCQYTCSGSCQGSNR